MPELGLEVAPPLAPRRERILGSLASRRVVETTKHADALDVSVVTIRSYLDALDRRMLLRRVRGATMAMQSARFERSLDLPSQNLAAENARIGATKARMVRDGRTIILDAGAATLAMALTLHSG